MEKASQGAGCLAPWTSNREMVRPSTSISR